MYETAVEAAVAYARAVGSVAGGDSDDGHGEHAEAAEKEAEQEQQQVVEEAEGWRLHLSSRSNTGYKGVNRTLDGRFRVQAGGPTRPPRPRPTHHAPCPCHASPLRCYTSSPWW